MSDREHSFFLPNGINPASSDWSITLQLIQGAPNPSLPTRSQKKFCWSCSRERLSSARIRAYLQIRCSIPKGRRMQRSSIIQRIIRRRSVRTASGKATRSRTVSRSSQASLPATSHRRKEEEQGSEGQQGGGY